MAIINLNSTIKCKDHDGYKAITVNEKQWMVTKLQGDIVECMTTEGPSDDFCWYIQAENFFTGETYVLKTVVYGRIEHFEDEEFSESFYVNGRTRADRLIAQILKAGKIDTANWKNSRG